MTRPRWASLDSRILVVLDNLESIANGGRLVHDLVDRTSCLTVLSTSRLPLRLRAEHEIPVPPLEVPPEGASSEEIAAAPAVEMFVDRALAVAPDFRLRDHADDVADLCRFLDGLPLAIELAAANTRLLTPGQIRAALEGDLGLLAAHTSDLPERQQTLVRHDRVELREARPCCAHGRGPTRPLRARVHRGGGRGGVRRRARRACCARPDRRSTFDPPGQLTRRGAVRRARHRPGVCTDPPRAPGRPREAQDRARRPSCCESARLGGSAQRA